MSEPKSFALTRVEVRDQNFAVEVHSNGKFSAALDGGKVWADSLDGLKERLTEATRKAKVKVSVEFHRWQKGKLVRGVITGIHSTNENLTVILDNGERLQETGYRYEARGDYLRIPEADRAAYIEAREQLDAAAQRVSLLNSKYGFVARDAVNDAMRAAETQTEQKAS